MRPKKKKATASSDEIKSHETPFHACFHALKQHTQAAKDGVLPGYLGTYLGSNGAVTCGGRHLQVWALPSRTTGPPEPKPNPTSIRQLSSFFSAFVSSPFLGFGGACCFLVSLRLIVLSRSCPWTRQQRIPEVTERLSTADIVFQGCMYMDNRSPTRYLGSYHGADQQMGYTTRTKIKQFLSSPSPESPSSFF